jgi:hypothetical protein
MFARLALGVHLRWLQLAFPKGSFLRETSDLPQDALEAQAEDFLMRSLNSDKRPPRLLFRESPLGSFHRGGTFESVEQIPQGVGIGRAWLISERFRQNQKNQTRPENAPL